MRTLLVLSLAAAAATAQWGRDINPGMGPQLVISVQDELRAIVKAAPAARAPLIERFVATHGLKRIEAIKRFRDPELLDLFFALLAHEDWHVRHRALLALEYYEDPRVLDQAVTLLSHPQRRLREKAAITCIKLWDGRAFPGLAALAAKERDAHVKSCLLALQRRVRGKLKPLRVSIEVRRRGKSGLLLTPFVNGMRDGKKPFARQGKGGAARRPATRWTTPLLGFDSEEVTGTSLQPFANPRQGGRVLHTGLDRGAALDGAGYYAAAEGVVRLIHSGSDMGTLIVVEHYVDGGYVNAVYMHGGDTVFVGPGEVVASGQLLGTMGLSFSYENGGHYAHLHYGLYPGPFSMTHNYGYKPAAQGLSDWIDPAVFLPRWIARTEPLVPALRRLEAPLRGVAASVERGAWGSAYVSARKIRDRAEPGSRVHADAVFVMGLLEAAPPRALARAKRMRDEGFARDAHAELKKLAATCRGVPGAEKLKAAFDTWAKDPLFKKALKGETKFDTTRKRAASQKDRTKARALWQKLLEDYGDTILRPRIEQHLR